MTSDYLLAMLVGYLFTITIETTALVLVLSRRHSLRAKLFAGVWLTACTYPVVWLVLPGLFRSRRRYLLVAETFAPVAECVLFWFAFIRERAPNRKATLRDLAAITLANLCSFALGELMHATGGFEWVLGKLRT